MLKIITCYHTEIVIVTSFYCLFKTDFSQVICSAPLNINLKEDEAYAFLEFSLSCCKI